VLGTIVVSGLRRNPRSKLFSFACGNEDPTIITKDFLMCFLTVPISLSMGSMMRKPTNLKLEHNLRLEIESRLLFFEYGRFSAK
jgi:hypothetical protein